MRIKNTGVYTIISDFDSLAQLYAECSTLEKISPVVIFMADKLYEVSENDLNNTEIQSFFRNLPMITVIATENIQQYPIDFLLLFDMRLSNKQYIFSGNENISDSTLSSYKISCGENAYYNLKMFLESDKKIPFESSLSIMISDEFTFDESVEQYIEKILFERTPLQINGIVSCLTAMRNGNTEKSLEEESYYFYKLIESKSEESNGII